MYIAEYKADLVSGGFEIDLVYPRDMASLRGGLEITPTAADSHPKEQAEAV